MCTLVCARVDLKVCHIKRTWYAILCVPNYSKSDDSGNDNPPTVIVMGDRQDQLIFLGIHRYSLLMRWVKYIECNTHIYTIHTNKRTFRCTNFSTASFAQNQNFQAFYFNDPPSFVCTYICMYACVYVPVSLHKCFLHILAVFRLRPRISKVAPAAEKRK